MAAVHTNSPPKKSRKKIRQEVQQARRLYKQLSWIWGFVIILCKFLWLTLIIRSKTSRNTLNFCLNVFRRLYRSIFDHRRQISLYVQTPIYRSKYGGYLGDPVVILVDRFQEWRRYFTQISIFKYSITFFCVQISLLVFI